MGLDHVSFSLETSDVLAVVGQNGSGKTTLLRVLAGVYQPDGGEVQVRGKISPLLGIGAGFSGDLSGRDNIYLSGAMQGLTRRAMDKKMPKVIEFSELGEAIDKRLSAYSSGMVSRLGFALALVSDPEILLMDEILSVGDIGFKQKAEKAMKSFMKQAKAVVIATHNMSFIKNNCNKVLWLEQGTVKGFGDTQRVLSAYIACLTTEKAVAAADLEDISLPV